MAKEFKRQRNIEIIARDYFKIAGVNSLEQLKKTDYWKYYQQEIASLSSPPKRTEEEQK